MKYREESRSSVAGKIVKTYYKSNEEKTIEQSVV